MDIFASPIKPHTQGLVAAVPLPQAEQPETMILLEGDIPSATHIPSGCRFHTRCPEKIGAICEEVEPLTHYFSDGSQVSSHLCPQIADCGFRILQVKKHNLKFKTDEILKSPEFSFPVIPVKTGIQSFQGVSCPAFGGMDFR